MNKNSLKWQMPFLLLLIVGTYFILHRRQQENIYRTDTGLVFGTYYNIKYQYHEELKEGIEEELKKVDNSLSTFNKQSTITRINKNESMKTDALFTEVFLLAKEISRATYHAFDITVAPLVNTWGFGFERSDAVSPAQIDSLRQFVGIDKVELVNGEVKKADPRLMLDASAIAKGYGVDRVAKFLESKGIKNYLVEIGGELRASGVNPENNVWKIGINQPIEDSLATRQSLQATLSLTGKGMATSGNYRNFYYKDGKKYAHTIDPRTGYPIQHNVLSATVIAPTCAMADAYATSFMVLGLDSALTICAAHPELDAYFIYVNEQGESQTRYTKGLASLLEEIE